MKKVSIAEWPRRELFEFFSGMSQPFFSVTFNMDVTRLYKFSKAQGISFYYALVYLATKAMNAVEAFRYTLVDGELYLLDERIPSFTDLRKGAENFHIVTAPCGDDIEEFCKRAKKQSNEQREFIVLGEEGPELAFFTCLPWVEMTAMTNERSFDRDDAIPRLAWGKYTERDGRKVLGMSMELNHRFTDGVHVGMFSEKLTELINKL